MNFAKFLRAPFLQSTSGGCFYYPVLSIFTNLRLHMVLSGKVIKNTYILEC